MKRIRLTAPPRLAGELARRFTPRHTAHAAAFACLAALLPLAACNTTNTVEPADSKAVPKVLKDRRVITNSALNAKAYVTDLREGPLPSGLHRVQAGLYNKTSNRQRVNYQFEWFDTNGIVIDAATNPWQTVTLNGRETVYITAVSPRPDAVDFQLKLLDSRN